MINIDEQKEKLIAEQIQLEEDLNSLGSKDSNGSWLVRPDVGDGTNADEIDNADITEDFEEKIARLNILEKQYIQVLKALSAIENKTYGICEVSGDAILEERLMVYPAATTCIDHSK